LVEAVDTTALGDEHRLSGGSTTGAQVMSQRMSNFEEVLKSGGHSNSLGRAGEVLDEVRKDNGRIPELFSCISSDDAWVRMRAIDTFEKLVRKEPTLAQPYLSDIVERLTKNSQPSIQWHIAQMFAKIDLTDQQRAAATEWLKDRIETVGVDWIVSVNVMKTLLQFGRDGSTDAGSLRPLFRVQTQHASKSVRKKAGLFLEQL
jgi:hypothetical protein